MLLVTHASGGMLLVTQAIGNTHHVKIQIVSHLKAATENVAGVLFIDFFEITFSHKTL